MATQTVMALIDNAEHVERVVQALQEAGVADKDISIVMREWSEQEEPGQSPAAVIARDTLAGLVAGAAPGLIATLVGGIFVPGLGWLWWLRAVGPVITILGAIQGALWGAAIGGISASDIPEEQIRTYNERLQQGHVLLAVRTDRENAPRTESLLSQHGAQEIYRTV